MAGSLILMFLYGVSAGLALAELIVWLGGRR